MLRNVQITKSKLGDIFVCVIWIVVLVILGFIRLNLGLCISIFSLLISGTSIYMTALRPILKAPKLEIWEEVQRSEPTKGEKGQGWETSWFIRLKVINKGQLPAKKCVGRLIEVRNEDKSPIKRFDPLHLYWARQDKIDNFQPLDIQTKGDFLFLDLIQFKEHENEFSMRVVIPSGQRLITELNLPEKPDLPVGTYFVRIAVYGENTYIEPTWYKLSVQSENTDESPCHIEWMGKSLP